MEAKNKFQPLEGKDGNKIALSWSYFRLAKRIFDRKKPVFTSSASSYLFRR